MADRDVQPPSPPNDQIAILLCFIGAIIFWGLGMMFWGQWWGEKWGEEPHDTEEVVIVCSLGY